MTAYVVWRQFVASDGTPLCREHVKTCWSADEAETVRGRVDGPGVVGVVEPVLVLDAPMGVAA